MPSLGFPITVELVEEPRTLFRACHGSTVTEITAALRSNYETGRPPHPADLRATILHMAVSMFENEERVLNFARRRPGRLGTHVARVELQPGHGICVADTGSAGHWSVWGRPAVLVDLVSNVVPVGD
jgi:hypothetical protein